LNAKPVAREINSGLKWRVISWFETAQAPPHNVELFASTRNDSNWNEK
jgi:hypothetical protein